MSSRSSKKKSKSPVSSRSSSSESKSSRSYSSSSSGSSSVGSYLSKESYSTFSSRSDSELSKLDDKSKKSSENKTKKGLSKSESKDSFTSLKSNLSRTNSIKEIEEDYKLPVGTNLSYNVYQTLFSIKDTVIMIHKLKKKYQENISIIKNSPVTYNTEDLKSENEALSEQIIKESTGIIPLYQVIYGNSHWRVSYAHTLLALAYLDFKNQPKQAQYHCENAWTIQLEDLKDEACHNLLSNQNEHLYEYSDPEYHKHQAILNYTYGRACTLLKENEEGEKALEKANDHYENWKINLTDNISSTAKKELKIWRNKIYIALAKQYAINNLYSDALTYYDRLIDMINKKKEKHSSLSEADGSLVNSNTDDDELLVEIYQDKAKIEQNKSNLDTAVDLIKDSIEIAEKTGSAVLVQDCRLSLALVFAQLDDMNSSSKAETLFNEIIMSYNSIYEGNLSERMLKAKDELVKFYLKQDKYDDACTLLNILVKEKIKYYGDFSIKINPTYKFLCSTYLKKNDMTNAAKFLKKSLHIEELNYGKKDTKTLATKETLDNLCRNPNVSAVINKPQDQPQQFTVAKKIDYSKSDYKLYSTNTTSDNATSSESFTKRINPIK